MEGKENTDSLSIEFEWVEVGELPKWVDMREPAAQDERKRTLVKLNYTTT
jgi:hypothetical protein